MAMLRSNSGDRRYWPPCPAQKPRGDHFIAAGEMPSDCGRPQVLAAAPRTEAAQGLLRCRLGAERQRTAKETHRRAPPSVVGGIFVAGHVAERRQRSRVLAAAPRKVATQGSHCHQQDAEQQQQPKVLAAAPCEEAARGLLCRRLGSKRPRTAKEIRRRVSPDVVQGIFVAGHVAKRRRWPNVLAAVPCAEAERGSHRHRQDAEQRRRPAELLGPRLGSE